MVLMQRSQSLEAERAWQHFACRTEVVADRQWEPQARRAGRLLQVGPSRELKTISAAASEAADGDTVEIDSGSYIGDRPVITADGRSVEGRDVWLFAGDNRGYAHNIYIGRSKYFEIRYSYSHSSKGGHLVKTRARENVVTYNRLTDGESGTSSYIVDIPEGGKALIAGNEIVQGTNTLNHGVISYAGEYVHPVKGKSRLTVWRPDVGAHERCGLQADLFQ